MFKEYESNNSNGNNINYNLLTLNSSKNGRYYRNIYYKSDIIDWQNYVKDLNNNYFKKDKDEMIFQNIMIILLVVGKNLILYFYIFSHFKTIFFSFLKDIL